MADAPEAENQQLSFWQSLRNCAGTERDRRNQRWFVGWLLLWAIAYVGTHQVLESDAELSASIIWFLALVPNFFMIGGLLAYLRFLRMTDELVRRIQLEGLAVGFGAGVVFVTGYDELNRVGLVTLDDSATIVVMMIGWCAGQLLGTWRYR